MTHKQSFRSIRASIAVTPIIRQPRIARAPLTVMARPERAIRAMTSRERLDQIGNRSNTNRRYPRLLEG